MSVASKRRYVTKQIETEYVLPEDSDVIAQVLGSKGNNLHEVEDANGEKYLVSMPSKFRKSVWIRRGQFVMVRPIEEGDKVKAEIHNVLDQENVLYIREQKLWPERFEQDAEKLTREAKRHEDGERKHEMIDADMLPPSDSEEDEEYDSGEHRGGEEEGDNTDSEENDGDSEEEKPVMDVYNPNRGAAPDHC